MDHKTLLSRLPAQTRQHLTTRSNAVGLWHLAGHLGAISLTSLWILSAVPGWPIAMALQGILLVFLFTPLHETCHDTPFASPWLNKSVGHVCGFVLGLPALWFRFFHLAHHRFTQIPGKDPELASPKPETFQAYVLHLSGIPVWVGQIRVLVRNAMGRSADSFVPLGRLAGIKREARIYLIAYGAVVLFSVMVSPVFVSVWLIPLLLGQPVLRLYLLAEHGRCRFVANMLENSRTTYTNRIVRLLAWNMPFHAEHHSFPNVPFHKLPALHDITRPHLAETENGYGAFHRMYVQGLGQAPRA